LRQVTGFGCFRISSIPHGLNAAADSNTLRGFDGYLCRGLRCVSRNARAECLPLGGHVLELGQANWYGDVDVEALRQDITRLAVEGERAHLLRELDEIMQAQRPEMMFEIADVYWRTIWQPASMTAIDFHGTASALRQDLNNPLDLPRQYAVVMNLGTAEHVFNVYQVFKSMHDHTLPGGMMVLALPFSGWVDHGFYNFNPTFYWDLAAVNGYTVKLCVYSEMQPLKLIQLERRETILELAKNGQIGANSIIYTALCKPQQPAEFRVPIQGYYASTISQEAAKAWSFLR
jgi:hypothetical protein